MKKILKDNIDETDKTGKTDKTDKTDSIDSAEISEKIKKACGIMGIREGASRAEIENKYYLLAKRHLILKRENIKNEVVGLNMEKINEAYYLLIGLDRRDIKDEYYGKPQKLIPYIWENYKGTVIIILIILIISLSLFLSGTEGKNINIVFFGEFQDDYGYIQTLKNQNIDDEIRVQEFILSENLEVPYKIQMMSAAYSFVTQGDYHILIMDKKSFKEYASVANIAKLDALARELNLDSKNCFMIQKQDVDEEEHVYGLNPVQFSSKYNFTDLKTSDSESLNPESPYIITVRDGLDSAVNKVVFETVRILVNGNIF